MTILEEITTGSSSSSSSAATGADSSSVSSILSAASTAATFAYTSGISASTSSALQTIQARRVQFPLPKSEGENCDSENNDEELISQAASLHRSIYPFALNNIIYNEEEYVEYISTICQPSLLNQHGAYLFIVEMNTRLLGFCLIRIDTDMAHGRIMTILDIVVHERWRGKQVGTRLFISAVEFGLRNKVKHLRTNMPTNLPRAQLFFARMGMVIKSLAFRLRITPSAAMLAPLEVARESGRWKSASQPNCRIVVIDYESAETSEHSMLLSASQKVYNEFHLHIGTDLPAFMRKMLKILKNGPSYLAIALTPDGNLDNLDQYKPPDVLGIANYQYIQTYNKGIELHINDLIVSSAFDAYEIGSALLAHIQAIGEVSNCNCISLDSTVERTTAHRFYWYRKMIMEDFQFCTNISDDLLQLSTRSVV